MTTAVPSSRWSRFGPIRTVVGLRRAWRRLSPFFSASRVGLSLLVLLSVLAGLVEASLLALIATMAVGIAEGDTRLAFSLGPIAVDVDRMVAFTIAITLALTRAVLQLALARLPAEMSARVLSDLRKQLFEAFNRAAWGVKAKERDGAFQTLMTQNVTSTSQAVINLGLGLTAAIMFTVMSVSAFLQSFAAALTFLVAALALFFVLRPLSRILRRHAKRLSEEGMSFTNRVQEVVQTAEEIEVFGSTEAFRTAFHDHVEDVRRPHARTRFLALALPSLYQSVALLLLVVSLIVIAAVGVAELASLAAVILMLIRALTYAQQMQTSLTHIDERVPFMHQVVDALERYAANPQQDGGEDLDAVHSLGLSHVSFGYDEGHDVLRDVSFQVNHGEAIGIVGPSGSGKSSTVQILLRLREPHTGELLVNGADARTIKRSVWQRRVAYVPQSTQLIWGSVWDNIRFHRQWITDDQIVAAAKRAHIHDDIVSWSAGYDTVIGQRANAVSGGQRQRICLARALADNPDVLVLDEPTSALDVRSEELVQASLQEIKHDTIIVLVAHRLSTLAVCDWIVVLVDGRVTALGSRADLMEQSEFFRGVMEITQRQKDL